MAGASSSRVDRFRAFWTNPRHLRNLALGVVAVGAFFALLLVGIWTRACANDACPAVGTVADYDPSQASRVYAADGREIGDFFRDQRRVSVPLKEMSPAVPAAFLSVEDKRFYEHHGVDWVRFFGALKHVLTTGGISQGFSTITMQLPGTLWPDEINRRERSGLRGIVRKIREIRIAHALEKRYTKNQILELYLNHINLGNSAYGVEAAAERYFGKSARNLNVAEAATLAALPKAPEYYNPRKYPRNSLMRRNQVIELMRDAGYLHADEAAAWEAYPLQLSSRSDYHSDAEYFVEYVRQLMLAKYGPDVDRSGYSIYTTLDLDVQQAAVTAVDSQLTRIENNKVAGVGKFNHTTYAAYMEKHGAADEDRSDTPYLQGAALVLEAKTGNILAMVGGRDFGDSKFNRITQALRQPGSSFKPILYTAAVESGISLDEHVQDAAVSIPMPDGQPNWEPKNFEGTFSDSMVSIRKGLWASMNTVAVRVGEQVGVGPVIAEARKFGITTPIGPGPSLFLGTPSVLPIQLIAGYTTFVNQGSRTIPRAIVRVEDRNGKIIWQPQPQTVRVVDPAIAYTMADALRGVITNGTAYSAVYRAGFTMPAGGKTGTTSDYHDAWFIGFTRDLVAGVWMGFDQPVKIMGNAQGGLLAAPAWTQMMLDIYQRRRDPGDWEVPADSMVAVVIDKTNGLRATPFCPDSVRETRYYIKGTEPTEFCPVHSPFRPGAGH